MRKHLAMIALTCAVAGSHAQRLTIGPRMTGERLVAKLALVMPTDMTAHATSDVPTREQLAEFRTIINYNFFEGYITSLHDATEGRAWCYNTTYQIPKGDALVDASRDVLLSLPAEQLKRNAADLLIELWSAKWPCPAERRQK